MWGNRRKADEGKTAQKDFREVVTKRTKKPLTKAKIQKQRKLYSSDFSGS